MLLLLKVSTSKKSCSHLLQIVPVNLLNFEEKASLPGSSSSNLFLRKEEKKIICEDKRTEEVYEDKNGELTTTDALCL